MLLLTAAINVWQHKLYKSTFKGLFVLLLLVCSIHTYSQSQQNIGFSPYMDGGVEGQPITGAAATFLVTPSYYFTVNNSNSTVAFNATGGRSGPKYLTWLSVTSTNSNGFYTPSDNASAIQNSTSYVVQFYYKFGASSGIAFKISASPDGVNFGSGVSTSSLNSTSSWTKESVVITSGSTSASSPNGLVRFLPSSTFNTAYAIDDIVMYPGSSVDNTAPDNASAATIDSSGNTFLTMHWTAPGSGVDGGGYMVVRYTADPGSSAAPNTNGIYAVGNTIGSGTVAYIGTNTSFTDNGLNTNTTYYYRVYTIDKAFNYSSTPATINGTTINNGFFKSLTVTNRTLLATLGDSVGIGTTTPTQKLEVNGNVKIDSGLSIGSVALTSYTDTVLTVDSYGKIKKTVVTGGGSSIDTTSLSNRINAKQDTLPSQAGNSGLYLSTNGSTLLWRPAAPLDVCSCTLQQTVTNQAGPVTGNINLASGSSFIGDGTQLTGLDLQHTTTLGNHTTNDVYLDNTSTLYTNRISSYQAYRNSIIIGPNNLNNGSLGGVSYIIGHQNTAINTSGSPGTGGMAILGYNNTINMVNGGSGFILGKENHITAPECIVSGTYNTVHGNQASTFGEYNTVATTSSFSNIFGYENTVSGGRFNTVVGFRNTITNNESSVFGAKNLATGQWSSVFGYQNSGTGDRSVAVGYQDTVTTLYGLAFGKENKVLGIKSVAIGTHNTVSGIMSHAFGRDLTNSVDTSVKIGVSDLASVLLTSENVPSGLTIPDPQLKWAHLYVRGYVETEGFKMATTPASQATTDAPLVLATTDGNGTAQWMAPTPANGFGGVYWTAENLGLKADGSDQTGKLQEIFDRLASSPTKVYTIWFENHAGADFVVNGNIYNSGGTLTQSGVVLNGHGIVLKFEAGNRIVGTGTITNFVIDASEQDSIFGPNLVLSNANGGIKTTGNWFSAKWVGADDKGSTDSYGAIQKAINLCRDNSIEKLIIPAGTYSIDTPLIVRPVANSTGFVTLDISGETSTMWGDNGAKTEIITNFNNAFALGIQRGKGCKIHNLYFKGQFLPPTYSDPYYNFFDLSFEQFTDQNTSNPSRDSRYSPYAAIVIDPFTNQNGLPPDNGYPGLNSGPTSDNPDGTYGQYNLYPDADPTKVNTGGSTDIEVEDIVVQNFVVGIISSPNGQTQNDELTKISRVKVENCKLAISGGQSQEKVNVVDGLACWENVHTVFATGLYGTTGAGNWDISNVNIAGGVVRAIYNPQSGWFPTHITNMYAESLGSLGFIICGNSVDGSNATQISNSFFSFPYTYSGFRVLAQTEIPNSPNTKGITFKNCSFKNAEGTSTGMVFDCPNSVFEECYFSGIPIELSKLYLPSQNTIYQNCKAGLFVFGENSSKVIETKHLTNSSGAFAHILFDNNYTLTDWNQEKYGGLTEKYNLQGKDVFVPFLENETPDSVSISTVSTPGIPTYRYSTIAVNNVNAYAKGNVVAFLSQSASLGSSSLYDTYPYVEAFGLITDISAPGYTNPADIPSTPTAGSITVSYISSSTPELSGNNGGNAVSNGKYYLACIYPAQHVGTFMGDIPSTNSSQINNVAPDWGTQNPNDYVGTLIKCPYNKAQGGWMKITGYSNSTSFANNGSFTTLGNAGTLLTATGTGLYFNNGATKSVQTTSEFSQKLATNTSTLIFYKGESVTELAMSDAANNFVCTQTGYQNPAANSYNNGTTKDPRLAQFSSVCPSVCNATTNTWTTAGNSGTNASTNFIGTTDSVSFRIRTNNIEAALFDSTQHFITHKDILVNGLTVGRGAGNVASNSANGLGALQSDSTGAYNTAVGDSTLNANTIGSVNTAVGVFALKKNTTGTNNTAVGGTSLNKNVNGSYNTALGTFTLFTDSSGTGNTALGNAALYSSTTASYNTGVGYYSLFSNTTGVNNTAVGVTSLGAAAANANYNVAIGYGAGHGATGSSNVFIGLDAGHVGAGSGNVFLGYNAGYSETGNNKLYIANSSTSTPLIGGDFSTNRLGIGTVTPTHTLEVKGGAAIDSLTISDTTTSKPVGIGADGTLYKLSNWAGVGGISSMPNLQQVTNAGHSTTDSVFIGGTVGIGTAVVPSGYQLAVNGTAIFTKAVVKLYGNWPDYVFDSTYKLTSISDLEKYVQQNRHLPEVPSSDNLKKDGIDLGSNQQILLKKIEELTLYMINQDKQITELQNQNKELQEQAVELKQQNDQLQQLQKQIEDLTKRMNTNGNH